MSLYCFVCRTRCFYCNKNHQVSKNNSQEYFIESCTQCNKWCYTNQKCKGDSDDLSYIECQNITQDNVNLENVLPLPFISPITTECDPKKHTSIHEAISVLLVGKHTSIFQLKNYLKFFNRKLTHLDPKLHNIFSLNRLNTNRVEGLFLSSFSVFKLLEPENEFKVIEELFNLFVDLFNFHGEFDPTTKQRNKELRNIVFCKTQDEVKKINVLYKNSTTYKFINKAIPNNLTHSDETEIMNDVKIWYGSNNDTFLDSVISRYYEKFTHIKQ